MNPSFNLKILVVKVFDKMFSTNIKFRIVKTRVLEKNRFYSGPACCGCIWRALLGEETYQYYERQNSDDVKTQSEFNHEFSPSIISGNFKRCGK